MERGGRGQERRLLKRKQTEVEEGKMEEGMKKDRGRKNGSSDHGGSGAGDIKRRVKSSHTLFFRLSPLVQISNIYITS